MAFWMSAVRMAVWWWDSCGSGGSCCRRAVVVVVVGREWVRVFVFFVGGEIMKAWV